jgi:hypothetical protein
VVDPESVHEQAALRLDHVVVVVRGEAGMQAVAGLARTAVPDAVRQDHVEARRVERRARAVELVRELR